MKGLADLVPDADALKMACAAFAEHFVAGITFEGMRDVLKGAGLGAVAARAFIERAEAQLGVKLPGARPGPRGGQQAGIRHTIAVENAERRAKRSGTAAPARYAKQPGGKTYSNPSTSRARVIYCQKCGAPVVDSPRARAGHEARCAG